MSYTMIKLAVPADQLDAMNRLAAIIDPDIGGGYLSLNASATGQEPATHSIGSAPVTPQTRAWIEGKDSGDWFALLTQMSAERGRDAPIEQDCIDVCATVMIDDEVTVIPVPTGD